ncbi:uncharacterized protein LOC144870964 [Branchiostoma floridae x Branchiostoma japonicum]
MFVTMLRAIPVVVAVVFAAAVSGERCESFSCPRSSDDSDEKYCCGYSQCCNDCGRSTVSSCPSSGWSGWSFSSWWIFGLLGMVIAALSIACRCYFLKKYRQRNQQQAIQMAPVAQPTQNPPSQYPQYPPAQPPPYPQYPPGDPPPYPAQNPAYPQNPPYPQNTAYPQNPPYPQDSSFSQNPPYPQNPAFPQNPAYPDPVYPPKV